MAQKPRSNDARGVLSEVSNADLDDNITRNCAKGVISKVNSADLDDNISPGPKEHEFPGPKEYEF